MAPALLGLAIAIGIDLIFGDPPNRFHPVAAMGGFIRKLTAAWNTGSATRRLWTGGLLIFSGSVVFAIPVFLLQITLGHLPFWIQGLLVGILLKPVFAFRQLIRAGKEIQCALLSNNLVAARQLTSWHLVSRDTSQLSAGHISSATIESLAENLTDSFLAPMLCFAVGGLPLAWIYRFINTADAMIGYRDPQYEYFGKTAARIDDVLNWIPARIAGYLIVIAASLSKFDASNALKTMLEQHDRTSSPNAGWTMSAAAGALDVILEKPDHYTLVGGNELPGNSDIDHAIRLICTALILSLFVCGGIIAAIQTII